MKLRSIALALSVMLVSAAAKAQSGVYITFNAQQFTQDGIYANPGIHGNVDRPWLYGPGYGIYANITRLPYLGKLKTGPFAVGIDARGETLRLREYGSGLNRQDGLFSLRVAPKKQLMGTTPYVQGGFGIGHTRIPFATHYSNNFVYQFGLGVDRRLNKHFDWRVVEATAGFLGDYKVGTAANQSNYLVTLGTGIVYRLR
ncbi:MAG TPA: hypothetical protein VF865_00685 [Acidobacteriaceae bacterium]